MKKIYIVLFMFVLVFSLSSCSSKITIEDVLPLFYEDVTRTSEKYSVTINSLNAYSENGWEFFDVELEKTYKGKFYKRELIYVYQRTARDSYFNINDGEKYFNYPYNLFLNAKSTGRHLAINEKEYTEQIKIAYDKPGFGE